ncbi:hypothetical protein CAPTEDRAFT_203288 [Capitella teleta]|uniref:Uncharacterized protein n=1 Tax=Capitella teleta TaxID=283909 RepID=R7TTI2_CAPTE|nr:hypothetical protein CAPTEDRAFT_203288 [Capitella teleta]|eukprot:ELT96917.1 hypothetical protein CAPTEDRAFT_203288 [Capitella teleta]
MDTEAVVGYLRSLGNYPNIDLRIECTDESVANMSSFPGAIQRGIQGSFFDQLCGRSIDEQQHSLDTIQRRSKRFPVHCTGTGFGILDIQQIKIVGERPEGVHFVQMFAAIAKCQMLNNLKISMPLKLEMTSYTKPMRRGLPHRKVDHLYPLPQATQRNQADRCAQISVNLHESIPFIQILGGPLRLRKIQRPEDG